MMHASFFGYGSLVNMRTHDYPSARPAMLKGWRRVWRHTTLREAAFLSVEPASDSTISGLVAAVPGNDWTALDTREAAYERQDVSHQISPQASDVAIYRVGPAFLTDHQRRPILLSYLDVVVQGYLQVFGEVGVADFFDTTDGWDAPIRDDRAAPEYPRHQTLSGAERAVVDAHLARLAG